MICDCLNYLLYKLDNLSGIKININGYEEYTVQQTGLYLVVHYHGGVNRQNYLTAISVSGYSNENKWYECQRLIEEHWSDSSAVNLEYNPYLKKLRNKTQHSRQFTLHLISQI